VICTSVDHNSFLRPITGLQARGWVSCTRVPIDPRTCLVDPQGIRRAIRPDTKFIAITHVSNVTGTIQPIREIGAIAREHDIPFIVDAAQSAGHLPIDLKEEPIDLLAAPGHKGLLGPLGTGFLYVRPGMQGELRPLVEGGTGSVSEDVRQPETMPDRFESGSHNAIGIAGLSAGVQWLLDETVEKVWSHEQDLIRTFIDGAGDIEGLRYFGPLGIRNRAGVFSVRIDGFDPHELATVLEANYGILTRAGLHCAPLVHAAMGTLDTGGTTRLSFGPFLSKQDVKFATDALAEIAMSVAAR
jgi:selenocysteine lyase/cysteine desulfurase